MVVMVVLAAVMAGTMCEIVGDGGSRYKREWHGMA
jgi:hypothetical protein